LEFSKTFFLSFRSLADFRGSVFVSSSLPVMRDHARTRPPKPGKPLCRRIHPVIVYDMYIVCPRDKSVLYRVSAVRTLNATNPSSQDYLTHTGFGRTRSSRSNIPEWVVCECRTVRSIKSIIAMEFRTYPTDSDRNEQCIGYKTMRFLFNPPTLFRAEGVLGWFRHALLSDAKLFLFGTFLLVYNIYRIHYL